MSLRRLVFALQTLLVLLAFTLQTVSMHWNNREFIYFIPKHSMEVMQSFIRIETKSYATTCLAIIKVVSPIDIHDLCYFPLLQCNVCFVGTEHFYFLNVLLMKVENITFGIERIRINFILHKPFFVMTDEKGNENGDSPYLLPLLNRFQRFENYMQRTSRTKIYS
jgi:hypothetical protein